MKIIAVGGSNTVFKNGYLGDLQALLPEAVFVNRSVGAANCSMGLFRLLSYPDLSEGDIVVWEYALNDTFSLPTRGVEWHLSVIEQTLIHARDRGCLFLPVILTTRDIENNQEITPYRAALHYLFRAYGVTPIDAAQEAHIAFNVAVLPKSDFRDLSHYLPGGRVCKLIAQKMAEQIAKGLAPAGTLPAPLFARKGYLPRVRTDLSGGTVSEFTNSLLSVCYRDTRGNQTVTFDPRTRYGRVIAAITLVSPGGGKCDVITPTGVAGALLEPKEPVAMTLLKSILGHRGFNKIGTGEGKVIQFAPRESTSDERPRGVVAVLTEEPA
ncbi:SGNH/GDSL hydrolase family protein [Paracoccus suum]|uniref:SGNH/GDSL hydrolase family protein n=1 Tax=Paracoccus suum TaxID=2259340 RepID=A0A344PL21_9RHOB|nr:SGNH/GDSL hydrolase family protein [Paracoccus suum]AXC50076.1 SGNH/GDSL hydrolase family protein [Paracoccus suum]